MMSESSRPTSPTPCEAPRPRLLRASLLRTALIVVAYAIAMAYVESAIVVYLRAAYGQQTGDIFPVRIAPASDPFAAIEGGREAATLVMLAAVGALAGRSGLERLAWTAVAFGAWDIAYYGWLNVVSGWPPAFDTWDILFLVPVPWTGPIWAPILVSIALVAFGLAAAERLRAGRRLRVRPLHVASSIAGGVLVVVSFTLDAGRVLDGQTPTTFAWPVFAAGMALAAAASIDALRTGSPLPLGPSSRETEVAGSGEAG